MARCPRCRGQVTRDGYDAKDDKFCVQCGARWYAPLKPAPVVEARLKTWTRADAVAAGQRGAAIRWHGAIS